MATQDEMHNVGQIPIIDIDISGTTQESEVAEKLVDAAARYGFVYVRNQGKDIPIEAINNMFSLV